MKGNAELERQPEGKEGGARGVGKARRPSTGQVPLWTIVRPCSMEACSRFDKDGNIAKITKESEIRKCNHVDGERDGENIQVL